MDIINLLLIIVALGSVTILLRLIAVGYYAALLPLISVLMYIPMEFLWVYTDSGEAIGNLQDTAWSLIEMGVIGGLSWLAWSIKQDMKKIGERLRKELEEDGKPTDGL